MNMRKFFLGGLVFCLGSLIFFISRCNMIDKSSYYVLEYRTGNTGNDNEKKIYAASIILVANAPCLKNSLKRNLETFFWKNITLDTINRYNSMYGYISLKILKKGGNIIQNLVAGIIQWTGEII